MKKLISLMVLWALMGYAAAADGVYMLEEALELNANQVRFSLAGAGSITVRSCRDCAPRMFRLATNTEFFADGKRIERDRFAKLSSRGGDMYVFYDTQTGDVTKMRLVSPLSNVNRSRR